MIDNIINMDSRSVLSQLNFLQISGELKFNNKFNCDEDLIYIFIRNRKPKYSLEDIIDFIKFFRNKYKISISKISLNKMNGWQFTIKKLKGTIINSLRLLEFQPISPIEKRNIGNNQCCKLIVLVFVL